LSKVGNSEDFRRTKVCDSILFVASLGGGTGTGLINPITNSVRSESSRFPILALGVLTEEGSDRRMATSGMRYLSATIAMYDLLTKTAGKGIDALILADNQILAERFNLNYSAMDKYIFNSLKPLLDQRNYPGRSLQDDSQAIRRIIWDVDKPNAHDMFSISKKDFGLFPSLLVPCYNIQPDFRGDINSLSEGALTKGRLFPCDPSKADLILVFTRGFFGLHEIIDAVQKRTYIPDHRIFVFQKLGEGGYEDMLILLRNPYGGTPGEHTRLGTLEWRIHRVITEALRYIQDNRANIFSRFGYTQNSLEKLQTYFYGEGGLANQLHICLDRLENGKKPIFTNPLRIMSNFEKDEFVRIISKSERDSGLSQEITAEIIHIVKTVLDAEMQIRGIYYEKH
jgi:hypothetical protein